eukprot:TRINITY_DN20843_c0_g1_i1.p1 TRINITY_DN20843_c0_g1~~TRINITY_DN20843_c0_g1_i1.p1  ORF type:complete len:518 (+),score=142.88 TRINITY_DN20843_c0_g1_i1:64-1554(+)
MAGYPGAEEEMDLCRRARYNTYGTSSRRVGSPLVDRRPRSVSASASSVMTGRYSQYPEVMMGYGGEPLDDELEEALLPDAAEVGKRTTNFQAFCTMLKAIVGSGMLFLPRAFQDGGVGFSVVCELCIAVLTAYCIVLLMQARGGTGRSFAELGFVAGGRLGRVAVQFSLITFQLGLLCAYFIFTCDTLTALLQVGSGCAGWAVALSPAVVIYTHCLFQTPVAFMRNLKSLCVLAKVADACILIGILIVLGSCLRTIAEHGARDVAFIRPATAPLFVGTSVVSFEGVAVMVPILESMERPEDFTKVLTWATAVVCVLYTTVGAFGAMAYGDVVEQNILNSIASGPEGSPLVSQAVTALFFVAIVCSLPLQAFPAYRTIELTVLHIPSGKRDWRYKWTKNALRASLLFALATLALHTRAYLHYIVAIIGGVAGVPMGFILPAYIHHNLVETYPRFTRAVIAFGAVMMVLVTTIAAYDWWASQGEARSYCPPAATAPPV